MGFDVLDTGFIGCLTDSSSDSNCSSPNVTYTFPQSDPYNLPTAVTHEVTTGCYLKPILKATSVTHGLASDDDLRFWVNCKVGNVIATYGPQDTSHGGGGCDDTGNDLLQGRSFTKAQLIAGIDLNAYDSTNAPEQDSSDSSELGWYVFITPYDISDCPTGVGISCVGATTVYNPTAQAWWMDTAPTVYTDGSGTFPQFDNGASSGVGSDAGSTSDYVLQLHTVPNHYADSSSMGDDSFGAEAFKIFIQYDTSCNTSGGSCGSYTWQDAIDNDTYLAAGDGGVGNEQTFDIVEADCWNEDYIYVRYKVRAYGPCGGVLYTDEAWTEAYLGEFDVSAGGVQCMGGP